MDSFGLLAYLVGTWFIGVDNPKSNESVIFLRMSVSQNKLLTYLWYLNLGYTLRSLGVIQKFNNDDNDD